MVIVNFFIHPKLFVIVIFFPRFWSLEKKVHYLTEVHYLQYLEVLYIQVRLYYAFVWPI